MKKTSGSRTDKTRKTMDILKYANTDKNVVNTLSALYKRRNKRARTGS